MPALPSGTVAFLFTDIEGSTQRWERDQAQMAVVVERHFDLLRTAIEACEGVLFKTIGDAVQAAFPTVPQAVAAAFAAQHAMREEEWGELGPISVRMAVHLGAAAPRGGDYLAPALNRLSRLLSTGYGGQVLLTRAAADLVRGSLPGGASLRDMGSHRLRDLLEPELIYQLAHPELTSEFPPLKLLDRRPNNLPLQPTSLVGRERELAALSAMLRTPDTRLVTLTGPGGAGKTRLALQAAAELLDDFPGGLFLIDLAPVSDPHLLLPAIAAAIGVREEGERPLLQIIAAALNGQPMLLILDNFEQIIDAAAVVAELLATVSSAKILVTSRILLQLRAEREFATPALAAPDPRRAESVERIAEYDAVRLFVARAEAARPGFALTAENAAAVAAICARLDGLPLAIELAAARVKLLPPAALLVRLEHRLSLLTGGARDLPARQRTLRDAIAWSHDLLSQEEQVFFRRLAVFSGSFSVEGVTAGVAATGEREGEGEQGDPPSSLDVFDGLSPLIDKSLLRQEGQADDGEPRFVMLETIREYALERLEASHEAGAVRHGHAVFFLAFAEQAFAGFGGDEQRAWLDRVAAEHDNLRAALRWWVAVADAEPGLRLAGALWWFWWVRGHLSEGRGLLTRTLQRSAGVASSARVRALSGAGTLAESQGDYREAEALHDEALTLCRTLGDDSGEAKALENLGQIALARRNYRRAAALLEEALAIARAVDDRQGIAHGLLALAAIAAQQGALDQATALYEESLTLLREIGDRRGEAGAETNLGSVMFLAGDLDRAAVMYDAALPVWRELGDRQAEAVVLGGLAEISRRQDKRDQAFAMGDEALRTFRELGDKRGIASTQMMLGQLAHAGLDASTAQTRLCESLVIYQELEDQQSLVHCLEVLAGFAAAKRPAEAARWLAVADANRQQLGAPLPPVYHAERDRSLQEMRAALGIPAFEHEWHAGGNLSLDTAISEGMNGDGVME